MQIHHYIRQGDLAGVARELASGADINGVETNSRQTPLMRAAAIGRFDAVALLLNAGADAQQLEWTELMYAVALGTVAEVRTLLEQGADLKPRDAWNRSAWLLSVQAGNIQKARLLLSAGADRNLCDRTPVMYAIDNWDTEMLEWLIAEGFDVNAADQFGDTPLGHASEWGDTDSVQILLRAGADPRKFGIYPPIQEAANLEIVRALVAAGEYLSDISNEMRKEMTGVGGEDIMAEPQEYRQGKHRRFGRANPQRMDIPFWKAMVRSGASAYHAIVQFDKKRKYGEPVWCYDRFGRTITELPDGRIVEIAGEHEDGYDPDFCIYNDVVVYDGHGDFEIFGYPENVFPPTDFHSATQAGEYIYLIGCLGYPEQRTVGETPVYRLHCGTFKIEKVNTTGDNPGWIYEHKARYEKPSHIHIKGGKVMVRSGETREFMENTTTFTLDLTTCHWSRLKNGA